MTEEEEARRLTTAVRLLSGNVKALNDTLLRDYPKRKEVEQKFITKQASKRRWTATAVGTLAAIIFSYFSTVGTVNYCFLAGIPERGAKPLCNVFPNWDSSFENNRRFLERYMQLEKEITENRARLDRIDPPR